MNIAYIITGLGIGGAEIVTIDIANRMVAAGNRVLMLYLNGENAHTQSIDHRIETVGLNMRKTPKGFFCAIFRARRILKSFKPCVVHGQMFHANIFARLLRICCRFSYLICTEHSKNIEGSFRMKLYRLTNFLSDLNTNVSQESIDYFIEHKAFFSHNSIVMYNGVDLSKFTHNAAARTDIRAKYNIASDEFVFLNVGRLTTAKDQRNLITAFAQQSLNSKLLIVGHGKLLPDLQRFATEKGIACNVIFAGAHTNVADYYAAADCFVLSSAWEGFGIVLAEAMACALPVITTDAGGCKEVVDNPLFVVPVGNSNTLAEKMNYLRSMSYSERRQLGNVNKEKAKRYDINTICKEWWKIYSN